MQTIFFPFTFIEPHRAERLAAVWGPLTLLQPSTEILPPETRRLEKDGVVRLLYPAKASDDLKETLGAFEQWAAQHSGSDLGALLEQGPSIPFFDNQSSPQLVAEIRRGGRPPAEDRAAPDRRRLFDARLYLAMAQNFDRQQAELARDIADLAAKETAMLALLKGEVGIDTGPSTASWPMTNPGSQALVDLRLRTWARVMAAAEENGSPDVPGKEALLFLTDSPDVMAQVRELFPEAAPRLRSDPPHTNRPSLSAEGELPGWLEDVFSRLVNSAGTAPETPLSIELDEIPAVSPVVFLERLAGQPQGGRGGLAGTPPSGSTWVGCTTLFSEGG